MSIICDNKQCPYPTSEAAKSFAIEISDNENLIQRYDPIDLCAGCENVLMGKIGRLLDVMKNGKGKL